MEKKHRKERRGVWRNKRLLWFGIINCNTTCSDEIKLRPPLQQIYKKKMGAQVTNPPHKKKKYTHGPKQGHCSSLNTFCTLVHPHAHTLEAIKYANTSSPILDRDRLSQGSVTRTHAHTELHAAGHREAQLPPGYLIMLVKKFWCNNLQKLQRQGQ